MPEASEIKIKPAPEPVGSLKAEVVKEVAVILPATALVKVAVEPLRFPVKAKEPSKLVLPVTLKLPPMAAAEPTVKEPLNLPEAATKSFKVDSPVTFKRLVVKEPE